MSQKRLARWAGSPCSNPRRRGMLLRRGLQGMSPMAGISSAYIGVTFAALALTGSTAPQVFAAAQDVSLLSGKIVSSTGQPLAGIPVKAHRANSEMTIAVY